MDDKDWSLIRAEYQRNQHAAVPEGEGYRAPNRGQQWVTHFDGRGFTVRPNSGQWSWGLELERYGFAGQERTVAGRARATSDKDKVRYAWGAVEEWFVNDGRGLEHGFTLPRRPARGSYRGPLRMHLGVRGGLNPQVNESGGGVSFVDASGRAVVTYAGLKVWDARGKVLPSRFEPAGQGGGFSLAVEEAGAEYPLTIDPIAQQAYLKASNTGAGDLFGRAVAISGNTIVVGAIVEDSNATGVNGNEANESAVDSGAAYVFVRSGGTWSQQAYLKASNTGAGDAFGYAVAVAGDTIVIGAPLEDGSATGVNGASNEGAADAGAAYVFVRSGGVWSHQAYLKPSNTGAGDRFGGSVSVSGDTIVVGSPLEDSNSIGVNGSSNEAAGESGAAYVFVRTAGVWSQQAFLKASNTGAGDSFGTSVGASGDTVVVGADREDDLAPDSGAVYVFVRSAGVWSQQGPLLKALNAGFVDGFGWSVGVSGNTVVVGAPGEASNLTGVYADQPNDNNTAGNAGAAYIFTRNGSVWSQEAYLKASNTQANDEFGWSVAVSGSTVIVGADREDSSATGVNGNQANNSSADSGAAYIFTGGGGVWSQQAYLKASNTDASDFFGFNVAVDGNTLLVGAFSEDSNATGVGGNQGNDSASGAGAAYVFTLPQLLNVSKTHSGNFTQGQQGSTYTVTVTNSSSPPEPTVGPVTVAEIAPAGLTLVSMAGSGWNCAGNACTRSDVLAAGASYPPIFVKVNVSPSAPALVTNQVAVSGGGSASDTGSDPTTINVACPVTLNPTGAALLESGGSFTVGVAALGSCTWSATSNAPWLTVTSQSVPAGNGSFDYSATANPNGTPRSGTIFVNNAVFTVTQERAGGGSAPLPLRFVPVTPCRIADTRNPAGLFSAPALQAGVQRDFEIPLSACSIPRSAVAYSLNMTVVPMAGLGFLSAWPAGVSQPLVSTLNSLDGRIKANAAIVPAGVNAAISLIATDPTHAVIDINGYFVPASQGGALAFYPVAPCRVADTRGPAGSLGGPALASFATRTFPVPSSACGIPGSAQAYAMNMTVVPSGGLSFLSTWPAGSPLPLVSTLNALTGAITANLAIVPAGTSGGINVLATEQTHLVMDITGYFAAPGAGGLNLYPVTPCRVVDTRNPAGSLGGPQMAANQTRSFPVPTASCGIPATAQAFSFNATVVPPGPLGFLTLWGSGARPTVSTLNSLDVSILSNAAFVPAGTNGVVTAFTSDATHLVLDINGYFQ